MNTLHLINALANENDPRPIILEIRTKQGLFKKVLEGVAGDENGIYLCAGDASELPDKHEDRVRVKPLPTSPHVEPDGQFYPVGRGTQQDSTSGVFPNPDRGMIAGSEPESVSSDLDAVAKVAAEKIVQADILSTSLITAIITNTFRDRRGEEKS